MSKPFMRGRSFLLAAALLTSAAAFTLSACSDDDNGPGTGAVAIAVAPTTLNIIAGSTGSTAYTITRTSPFTGAVTLSAAGQPTASEVNFTPGVADAGVTTGTVDVVVAADATPGTYPVTISAAGTGVTTRSTTLTVVVTEVPAGAR